MIWYEIEQNQYGSALRYHFRFDHHLINDFNDCDRYFQFKHMPDENNKVWSGRGWASAMRIGIWWARTMELFYREMSFGTLPSSALMTKFAADAWSEESCQLCRGEKADHDNKDHPWTPQSMKNDFQKHDPDGYDKFKGAEGALQMALEYYDSFAEVDFRSWKIVGAEKGFGLNNEILIGEDDLVVVHYTGRPDLSVLEYASGKVMPLDFKTKESIPGNVNELFKPHPQTVGYIFAINELVKQLGLSTKETDRCIIRVCARTRPTDNPRKKKDGSPGVIKPRFVNVYPNYNSAEIEEWKQGIMAKARRLRYAIEHNEFIPREKACHLFYHGCQFRGVCSTPPASRELVLRSNFTKIEPWTPYNVEED